MSASACGQVSIGVAGGLCRGPLGLIFLLLLGEHVRASLRAGHGTQERGPFHFISVVSSFLSWAWKQSQN